MFVYRLLDASGAELGTATYSIPNMKRRDTVHLGDGTSVTVLEVLEPDGADGQDLRAVLVLDTKKRHACGL